APGRVSARTRSMINATCSAFRGKPSGSVSPSFATTVQPQLKQTQELSTNKVGAVFFPTFQVRMAERSKAPDSRWCTFLSRGISGLRMEAWVRITILTAPFDFKLQYPAPVRGGKRVTIDSRMESESD